MVVRGNRGRTKAAEVYGPESQIASRGKWTPHIDIDEDPVEAGRQIEQMLRWLQDPSDNPRWHRFSAILDGFAHPQAIDLVFGVIMCDLAAEAFMGIGRNYLASLMYAMAAIATARAMWRVWRWRR